MIGNPIHWAQGAVKFQELHQTFNDDVNEDLINLHHHRTPFDIIPELVRDFRVEAEVGSTWQVFLRETDNRKRKSVHKLELAVAAAMLRIIAKARTVGHVLKLWK